MNFKQIFNFLAQLQVYNDRNWFSEPLSFKFITWTPNKAQF